MISDPVFSTAMAGFLVLLFGTASWFKFSDLAQFESSLGAYRALPDVLLPVFSRLLPVLEALVVMTLLNATTLSLGLFFASSLLMIYGLAMATNLLRGRTSLECGCGGPAQTVSWFLVLRNLACALVAVTLGITSDVMVGPASSGRAISGVDLFTTVLASFCLFLLYLLGNQLAMQSHRAQAFAADAEEHQAS